jgi:hypothetical protein
MFAADERKSLCDIIAPPENYRFVAGIAATYSLDFVALTAACSALLGDDAVTGENGPDNRTVLKALLGLRGRLSVFVNQAGVSGNTNRNDLFATYDGLIHPVQVRGHAFHPKIWLLKFRPTRPRHGATQPFYRIVCGSRNLTTAQTWECCVVLDGTAVKGSPGQIGPELRRFLSQVLKRAGGHAVAPSARRIVEELGRVRFTKPGTRAVKFYGQWPGGPRLHVQCKGSTRLLVAPFVSKRLLSQISRHYSDSATVVSTSTELDRVSRGDSILQKWLVRNAYVVQADPPSGVDRLELHAKLRVAAKGVTEQCFIGSANGTGAAWGEPEPDERVNWEAVVAISGHSIRARFEKNFIRAGLKDDRWIKRYKPGSTFETETERLLEDAARLLGNIYLRAGYRAGILTVRADRHLRLLPSVEYQIAPYLLEDDFRDIDPLYSRGIQYRRFPEEKLSEFFVVQFRPADKRLDWHRRVLMAESRFPDTWRRNRDQSIVALNRADLQAVCLSLLDIELPTGRPSGTHLLAEKTESIKTRSRKISTGVLERMLRVLALEPDRITAVFDQLRQLPIDSPSIARITGLIGLMRNVG